jgi:Leucine-rich repeat (LRR) protein
VAFSSESNIQSETVDLENFSKFITATYPDDNKLVLKVIAFGLKFIPDTWILGVPFSEVQSMNLSDNIFDMQHQNDSIFFDSMLALKSLDLSGNRINHIPAVFSVLSKLNFLNMAKNYITEMSKTLLALNGLESLSMDDNIISVIPDGITSLTRLRFLSLKGNPFTDLPPLMCQLGEVLETLLVDDRLNFPAKEIVWEGTRAIISELTKVHHNMMSTSQMLFKQGYYRVPQMLAEYTRVTQLDLSKNSIQSVPEFFCRLVHLETLDFSKNRLVHIGKWVVSTSVLHHLDVSYNNLGVLSASLGVSKSLKYINASFNKITKISRSILGSPSLLTLDIVGNIGPIMWLHFQGLQKRIYTAKQKGKLWPAVEEVQADRLSHPSSMAFATYVWCSSQPHWSIKNTSGEVIYKEIPFDFILDALNDGLITEHFEIMCMNKASEKQTFRTYKKISFSIVFCEATRVWREKRKKQYEIDSDTWFLPNKLNSIMAQSCRFAGDSLPRSLVRSRDMSILDMSDCCLSTIPQCVGFLTGLRLLKLMRNNIVALPEELGYCTNLESIDLSQNNINALPDMFSRLSKLIIFTINENQLGVFPNSFSSLKSLSTLSFVRNSVICIDALNGLQNLTNLDGGCNALESIGSLCLCTTLENLRLPENKIKCLADGIQSMTRLQILNLRKNVLESLPTTLVFLTKLKNLDMRDNPVLASLLPPAMFNCYVNGPILRKYLKTVEAFDSITSLDLTFLDYTEIPKFVISWTTRRQKARSRWFWAISKVNSIIRRSFVSTLKMSKVESKANEDREASAAKIVGIKLSDTNVSVEQKAFDSNQLDRHLDDYYGRDHDSGHLRTRRIPWHLQKHFNREQLQSEHPEVFSVINSDSLSDVEKFEKIVTNMLLENPFFKSMIEYSWFYSNQQLPDGGKMTTQGPLRIHGILMLWLRDVIDMNSYVWADIVDENDAVLLYEWTKLSELPFFAQFLLLSTTCIDILTSLKLVPDVDILNQISICLLKHHKSLIKKRAYRDAYAAAIDMGVSDIQIVLMKDDEVIKAYGRITQLSESIEEDWEAVVGLEEKTAFLRNDDSAVVAYSRFQEEFFLLRVLIATDDFTPLPKYRQFSFVQESTRLFLSGNKLSRVSPLLSCLYILVELNFSGNEIMDLPITMKKLLQLQHLQLSRNRFQFLPEVLEYLGPNLVTLTLAWNSIKVIPDMIRSFSRIQELNFSYNRIATASNLINLSTLTALHLAGNNLARIFAIASMSSLTTLTLNDNPINYFPATFGNFNNNLKVISIDSWTRTGLPPCFLKNATFWLFTSPSSDETFDRPL